MNIVVSDPKTGKAYSKKLEKAAFLNKEIGEEVPLEEAGLKGFKGFITGGSDNDGFPMKPTLPGTIRKKLLLKGGVGFNPKLKGERKRITARGKRIAEDIHQVNIKLTGYGPQNIESFFAEEVKKETKETATEKAMKIVKETAGKKAKEGKKEEAGMKKGEKRG